MEPQIVRAVMSLSYNVQDHANSLETDDFDTILESIKDSVHEDMQGCRIYFLDENDNEIGVL